MASDRPSKLTGSTFVAEQIERRRFLRRSASGVFLGIAAAMVANWEFAAHALADPTKRIAERGPGCPNCCGPSPCCSTSQCRKNCCSQNISSALSCPDSDNGKCRGANGYCWTCNNSATQASTCCDCNINDNNNCPDDDFSHTCICYRNFHI